MDIQPIQTVYNGYKFRSRLESRWAVFFDALGVKYEYEPEGYQLSNKICYIPDFKVQEFGGGGYFEVKPDLSHINLEVIQKLYLLSKSIKEPVYLLVGPPDFIYYWHFGSPDETSEDEHYGYSRWISIINEMKENEKKGLQHSRKLLESLFDHGTAIIFCGGDSSYNRKDGYYVDPGSCAFTNPDSPRDGSDWFWYQYQVAVNASRKFRFEYNNQDK